MSRKHTLEELLLELGLGDLDLDSLVDLLLVSPLVVGIVLDSGGEQGVDEGRLAQTGLASNLLLLLDARRSQRQKNGMARCTDHDREGRSPLGDNFVPLVGQIGNANR